MDIAGYKLIEESKQERKSSCTYDALNVETESSVLIKVFNKKLSTDSIFRTHFRSVTRVLRHEPLGNNARILDSKVVDNACILIMEHQDYTSKKDKKLSNKEILEIGRQIASSLSLLHKQKIIHGGVELSNIIISHNKEVVLGPVEIQRTMPGDNPLKRAVDKVEDIVYRAPEANSGLTASTDFYSLGVLLYELLMGKKPFETESITLLEQSKKKGSYSPLNTKFRYLTPLFKKLLSPNPKMRVSNVYELEFILSQCEEILARRDTEFNPESGFISGNKIISHTPPPHKKIAILRPLIIGFSISGVLGIILYLSGFINTYQKDINDTRITQPITLENKPTPTDTRASPQSSDKPIELNNVYASAHSLAESKNLEAALEKIANTDPADSKKNNIKKLKLEVKKELEIRSSIATAETQFNSGNLLSPPGDNAFETYQKTILLTPENDTRAFEGLTKIANHYLDISIDLKEQHKPGKAKESIALGLKAKPGHRGLLELRTRLNDAILGTENPSKTSKTSKQKTANITTQNQFQSNKDHAKKPLAKNKNKSNASSEKQPPQLASLHSQSTEKKQQTSNPVKQAHVDIFIQKNDSSTIKGNNTLPENNVNTETENQDNPKSIWINDIVEITKPKIQTPVTDKSTEKYPTLFDKALGVDKKIALVEKQLSSNEISTSSLKLATNNYNSLRENTHEDKRVSSLREKILDSYVTLAKQKEISNQLVDALDAADSGLALNNKHEELLTIKNRIKKSLSRVDDGKKPDRL